MSSKGETEADSGTVSPNSVVVKNEPVSISCYHCNNNHNASYVLFYPPVMMILGNLPEILISRELSCKNLADIVFTHILVFVGLHAIVIEIIML